MHAYYNIFLPEQSVVLMAALSVEHSAAPMDSWWADWTADWTAGHSVDWTVDYPFHKFYSSDKIISATVT